MFSHIMVGADDLQQAKQFYDAVMSALGYAPPVVDEAKGRFFYVDKSGIFGVTRPINGEPTTHANGGTIGFAVDSPEMADAWHAAGLANGGRACEEPPGIREGRAGKLYLAYLRDPAGNKICAMHRLKE